MQAQKAVDNALEIRVKKTQVKLHVFVGFEEH